MNKLKILVSTLAFTAVSFVYGQTTQATFASSSEVWSQSGSQHVSEFTVIANQDGLNQIQEKYNGLGSDVSFIVKNSTGNSHTLEMTFSDAVQKIYLHKMLLFIGCETVKIGTQEMSLDNFAATLSE
jgi:hypothetical protein